MEKRGQIFGFTLGLGAIGLGALGMLTGNGVEGLAAFLASVAALAGAFLFGTKSQRDERIKKAEIMAQWSER